MAYRSHRTEQILRKGNADFCKINKCSCSSLSAGKGQKKGLVLLQVLK